MKAHTIQLDWLGVSLALVVANGAAACGKNQNEASSEDPSSDDAASGGSSSGPTPTPTNSALSAQSWDVCRLAGPKAQDPGVYGSDLGYTVPKPSTEGELAILFGDTWSEAADACAYPTETNDDLQATLPQQRPEVLQPGAPAANAGQACCDMSYATEEPDDPTSWPPIRLFEDTGERSDDKQLPMGMLHTPVAAFSDGEHIVGMFHRDDPVSCESSDGCPGEMVCSKDPAYQGKEFGECAQALQLSDDEAPAFCIEDDDCTGGILCNDTSQGVCLTRRLFQLETSQGTMTPGWYDEDPRRGIARTIYIATPQWPDRPNDYGVGYRFRTHRFVNVTARGVAHFDPDNPENNDYSQGTHTLLLWGRPHFATTGGWQSLPFLLYQPLDGLVDDEGNIAWDPRYFAGYETDGSPRWSGNESDAMPVYGTEHELVTEGGSTRIEWKRPEFDYVNQMGISWVEPLQRWVMLYGGGVPPWQVIDPATGEVPEPVHPQPEPGAIHLRSAAHPWGRATGDAPERQAWTLPQPIVTRSDAAAYLSCSDDEAERVEGCVAEGDAYSPDDLMATLQGLMSQDSIGEGLDVAGSCLAGDVALEVQNEIAGGSQGHLYGANIIDAWTQPLDGGAEIYWNISTWNPYQVVLMKTRLSPGMMPPE